MCIILERFIFKYGFTVRKILPEDQVMLHHLTIYWLQLVELPVAVDVPPPVEVTPPVEVPVPVDVLVPSGLQHPAQNLSPFFT